MPDPATFEDLSVYTHLIAPHFFEGVFNVGWIDVRTDFRRGAAASTIVAKLQAIACGSAAVRALVSTRRRRPQCAVCGSLSLSCGEWFLPEAQLWIRADGRLYASPISIIHYIDQHGYEPPSEYVDAVAKFDLDEAFHARALYEKLLVDSGWFASQYGK